MNQTDILKNKLLSLKDEVNQAAGKEILSFNQQSKVQENMSYSGCNGRLWIQPSIEGYDISLSGASVEKELAAIEKKIASRKSRLASSSKSSQGELDDTQKQLYRKYTEKYESQKPQFRKSTIKLIFWPRKWNGKILRCHCL